MFVFANTFINGNNRPDWMVFIQDF